ncbi:hypothetical protein BGY98DRAFT_605291 [Russula aff. rugulosa BPL654]|nr:hypothetical protein BGY98DRAFT_605291 [Russula aff. rugulosa BPL654]
MRTTRPNHSLFCSHCLVASPFLFLYFTSLVSHSRTNAYRHLATTTRHPYVLSFVLIYPPLYTLMHSIQSPLPVPPKSPLRYRYYK